MLPTFSISVNITNDGCDYASGTYTNPDDGGSGNLTMTKPADIPDENPVQTSAAFCWLDQCPAGGSWTIGIFRDTIGSSKSMAGRQAYESQGASSQDNCWYQGSVFDPYGLSGGGWYVGNDLFGNEMDFDQVGIPPAEVAWYNGSNGGLNRVPCVISAPQTMALYTHTSSQPYILNTVSISLQQGQYGVGKTSGNSVQAWRPYACGGGVFNPQ